MRRDAASTHDGCSGDFVKLCHAIVADDSHAIRQSLKTFLYAVFHHVRIEEAQNGNQVLDLVAADPPNLILMDVEMPQVNGMHATRMVKAGWPAVRVIILALDPNHLPMALQAGADACILKGFPSEELLRTIAMIGFEVASIHERTVE